MYTSAEKVQTTFVSPASGRTAQPPAQNEITSLPIFEACPSLLFSFILLLTPLFSTHSTQTPHLRGSFLSLSLFTLFTIHQICKKSFKRPQDLKKHEKIHTEEHHQQHKHSKAITVLDPLYVSRVRGPIDSKNTAKSPTSRATSNSSSISDGTLSLSSSTCSTPHPPNQMLTLLYCPLPPQNYSTLTHILIIPMKFICTINNPLGNL